jgi:predicted dehydrogenase
MQRKIRWGLMGAGKIVNRWIRGARQLEDMDIVAVASRTIETAQNAAKQYRIPEALAMRH